MSTTVKTFPYTCNARHLDREIMGERAKSFGFKFHRITTEKKWLWMLTAKDTVYKFRNLAQVEIFFAGYSACLSHKPEVATPKKERGPEFERLITSQIA
jgi:hypothetical protein